MKKRNNYTFIDGTNLHLTFKYLNREFPYQKFMNYLAREHDVFMAYYFIGLIKEQSDLYQELESYGYTMQFRTPMPHWIEPVVCDSCQKVIEPGYFKMKCDCDADIAARIINDMNDYDRAVFISSDGDFDNIIKQLIRLDKLKLILAPCRKGCSDLLIRAARGRIQFLDELQDVIEKY